MFGQSEIENNSRIGNRNSMGMKVEGMFPNISTKGKEKQRHEIN